METHSKEKQIIGIDLAKKDFQAHLHINNASMKFENDTTGFKTLWKWLKAHHVDFDNLLFLMEYTGRYHYKLCQFLQTKECAISIVSALEIRRSLGVQRGKSDPIDAQRIAEYGYRFNDQLRSYKLPDKALIELKTLRALEQKLMLDNKGNSTWLKELEATNIGDTNSTIKLLKKTIKQLKKSIKDVQTQIKKILDDNLNLKRNFDLLTSIKGVGEKTALLTLITTDNFTKFKNARQFNCYCGVAPFPYQSGSSINGRNKVNHLANKEMKSILYMCAMNAKRFDTEIKQYYDRKLKEGKPPMLILNAIKNKLIARMFAVIKRQSPYVDTYKYVA